MEFFHKAVTGSMKCLYTSNHNKKNMKAVENEAGGRPIINGREIGDLAAQ